MESARKWQLSIIFSYWCIIAAYLSLTQLCGGYGLGLHVSSGTWASASAEGSCQHGIPSLLLASWRAARMCLEAKAALGLPLGIAAGKGPWPVLWWALLMSVGMVLGWRDSTGHVYHGTPSVSTSSREQPVEEQRKHYHLQRIWGTGKLVLFFFSSPTLSSSKPSLILFFI